jgi:hypothetical protein
MISCIRDARNPGCRDNIDEAKAAQARDRPNICCAKKRMKLRDNPHEPSADQRALDCAYERTGTGENSA